MEGTSLVPAAQATSPSYVSGGPGLGWRFWELGNGTWELAIYIYVTRRLQHTNTHTQHTTEAPRDQGKPGIGVVKPEENPGSGCE